MMNPANDSSRETRLAHETSPYLLQHKNNPVDWWPWGPEALAEAQRSGKPILLSVGYAACHWCHVMAHESFEDPATAAVMNELFVNIKVDREERPDIDQIYMAALHHLGEQGGWPLTMFLTSQGEPVWGGTYFPKTSRYGRPAFVDVLRELARLFREEPGRIDQNRAALMQRLAARANQQAGLTIAEPQLDELSGRILAAFDPLNGGLQGAPKFPQAAVFEMLWRAGLRAESAGRAAGATSTNKFFAAIEHTLERICQGGIYDHLGGGFARYSVDERWLVPHFEKMLYDNAHLLALLALAWQRSGNALFRTRAIETVAWLTREMTMPDGGFASSLDADSEGEEGKFYVWSADEIEALLGAEDAAFFAGFYDVSRSGNFEGHTILNRLDAPRASPDEEERLARLRAKLFIARVGRIAPGLDDKVLADWNGMMIAALARAGAIFAEPDWIALAERAFAFVATTMSRGDRLGHSWREGRLLLPGLASDYAWMTRAALALHEVTGVAAYLQKALAWQAALDMHHRDEATGGYFLTADDAAGLVIRPHATSDDAIENHNAVAAENLVRLAPLTGDAAWGQRADRLFDGIMPAAAGNAFGHAGLLNALDFRLRVAEIVVTGQGGASEALSQAALRQPYLQTALARVADVSSLPPSHPLRAKGETAPQGGAFVCVGERCSLPVTDAAALEDVMGTMRAGRSLP